MIVQYHTVREYVSNEKHPGCLCFIRDITTQLYGDYNKPF